MQKLDNAQFLYAPTDLVAFLGCRHATYLDAKSLTEDLGVAKGEADAAA